MTDLHNRTVIVTGAGSGIGRATAHAFAGAGATVVAADLDSEALAATAETGTGQDMVAVVGDITDSGVVEELAATAAEYGGTAVLVNNAGVMDWFLPAGEVDDDTWRRVMEVNVSAPMRLMRATLPQMEQGGRGAIVNVASIAGFTGGAAGVAYTASKHALIGMTRNTAFFYGPRGIRTNAVCPGGVETHIADHGAQPRVPWAYERLQAGFARAQRQAAPEEIAALILWLASDAAVNVNGAVIPSDGGWTAS